MRGFALNIGVGKVNPKHYNSELAMMSCEKDALSFHNYLDNSNLYGGLQEPLISEKATSDRFFSSLNNLAKLANSHKGEAYVVLTFSGHGMTYKFPNQKEKLELLCFFDRMVLEHEIVNSLYQFGSHVKIFIVLDACHSQGIGMYGHAILKDGRLVKALSKPQIDRIIEFNDNETFYLGKINQNSPQTESLPAAICLLSACGKEFTTTGYNDNTKNSHFTQLVLGKMLNESQIQNHSRLNYELLRSLPYPWGPRMSGDNNIFFESHKPFIYNVKPKTMDWNITINVDSSTQEITCNLDHPGGYVKAGSIIETNNKNHHLLSGKDLNSNQYDYQDGDIIIILILDKNHATGASYEQNTAFELNRQMTTIATPKMFAIAYDNTPGNRSAKGNGRRSSHKVTDELGGS